jgi:hypothetical protein
MGARSDLLAETAGWCVPSPVTCAAALIFAVLVQRLHADEGDRLFLIEGPNGAYQLTPHDAAFEKKMKKASDIIGRYRNTHALRK